MPPSHAPIDAAEVLPEEALSPRPWPVRAVGILLVIQAVGMLIVGVYSFILNPVTPGRSMLAILNFIAAGLTNTILFSALAALALVAALTFSSLRPNGWTYAMLVQGLNLSAGLVLYFRGRPPYVYIVLLASIGLVIYLYHPDIQAAFLLQPATDDEGEPLP